MIPAARGVGGVRAPYLLRMLSTVTGQPRRLRSLLLATLLTLSLAACGGTNGQSTSIAPTTETRANELAATATTIAIAGPPGTPPYSPSKPRAAVASIAATPILPAVPTQPDLPREGTPRALPGVAGALIAINEHRLWIACRGEGTPTVVMDAGVNSGSQVWALVWPTIGTSTRVCVYDRAGLGYSERIPRPRTSQEVVNDLHELLTNADVQGPYVLVAHSFGGLNIRLYASEFPQDVAGMVLVDAVHEDRFAATARVLTPQQEAEFERGRQANPEGLDYYESSRLVRAIGPALPDIPIVVIARGRAEPWPRGYPTDALERVWRNLERDLASRAPQGTLLIAEQADHNIPGQQPAIIIDATNRVLMAIHGRR